MNFDFKNLKIGALVEIEVINERREQLKMKTVVEEIKGDNIISVLSPIYHGLPYQVHVGDTFTFVAVFKYPTVDKYDIYACRATAIEKEKKDDLAFLTIQRVGEFQKIQRRNFFRLPIVRNVPLTHDNKEYEMISKDLSGSGIKGYIQRKIPEGAKVIIHLDIDDKVLALKLNIIECQPDVDDSSRYMIRGSFDGLKNSQMSELQKFIFNKQAEVIRRQYGSQQVQSILDTDKHYGDYYAMTNTEKIIRIWPILLWALTFITYAYLTNAFKDENKGINFFFGEYTRRFKPENLMTASILALILIVLAFIGFILNMSFNKHKKHIINIQYVLQGVLAIIALVVYFVVL